MPRSAQDTRQSEPSATVTDGSGDGRSSAEEAAEPRTFVVGYDGSDEARAAFAVAVDRSRPGDTVVPKVAVGWNKPRREDCWLGGVLKGAGYVAQAAFRSSVGPRGAHRRGIVGALAVRMTS